MVRRFRSLTASPARFQLLAYAALGVLTLIVFTGAAVRLTGSGLGCPDWPRCYGGVAPPLETHVWIEYGNRLLTGVVGLPCILVAFAAWVRRPFRRDLAVLATLLPVGVLAQAILGGFTVWYDLAPGFVMAHHALSMIILIAATALVYRARLAGPDDHPVTSDGRAVWAVRGLVPLAAATVFLGTIATAAGPHGGGDGTGDVIRRLQWHGADTLEWAVKQHGRMATLLGLAALAVWWLLRRRGAPAHVRRPVTALCLLLGALGVIGAVQYALELPAELVWVHVALAAVAWIVTLWCALAAGRLVAAKPGPRPPEPAAPERELAPAA